MAERLDAVVADLEAQRFVGRQAVLEVIHEALSGRSGTRIVHLHGPAGVGKSATLRAISRTASDEGRPVVQLDGRLFIDAPDALATAVGAAEGRGSVLLVDEVDSLGPLGHELRRLVGSRLSASTLVVLAGRPAPDPSWFEGGLDQVSTTLGLRPLSNEESREVLRRHGVSGARSELDRLVDWSAGFPLALTLAATLEAASPAEFAPTVAAAGNARLDQLLLERLAGAELAGISPDVLDVACVSTVVDGRLLAAALPGRQTRAGLAQLRACSLSEPLGAGITLHRLIRSTLRERLRSTDPDRYRDLVLRVARHLRGRALGGDHRVVLELAELVENPDLRLGFDPSPTHYLDRLTVDDLDRVATFTGAGDQEWFERVRRWCIRSPRHALAVRRASGDLVGMSILCMADETPSWAADEIETGPVLDHARASGRFDSAVLLHDLVILEDQEDAAACAEVIRVGNIGAITTGVTRNARFVYVTASSWRDDDGTEPLGYQDVPELRRGDHERQLETIMTDFGPDGAVGRMFDLILAEQGVEPEVSAGATAQAYDAALRSFLDDEVLAASVLAPAEGGVAERSEAVRDQVRAAIDSAFGATAADRLLRQSIERTYLDLDGGHGIAQRELHMSRATFYRHLRKARERVIEAAPGTDG